MLRISLSVLVLTTFILGAGTAPALETPAWIEDHFSVGLRSQYFGFTSGKELIFDENGTFIGGYTEGISIITLEEIQNGDPLLYGRYQCTDYVAIELGQERLRGNARSYYGHTDGELDVKGFSLQVMGMLPNHSRFNPYISAGLAFLHAEFDHAPWGYGVHIIDTEDRTTGLLLTGGCSVQLWRGLSVDVDVRYIKADVDAHFNFVPNNSHYYWTFPIDSWAAQAGLKWTF